MTGSLDRIVGSAIASARAMPGSDDAVAVLTQTVRRCEEGHGRLEPVVASELIRYVAEVCASRGRSLEGIALVSRVGALTGSRNELDVLISTGALHRDAGDLHNAALCIERGLNHPEIEANRVDQCRLLNNRGVLKLDLRDYEGAALDFQLAHGLAEQTGQDYAAASSMHNRGVALARQGRVSEALAVFDQCTTAFGKLDRPFALLESLLDRVDLLLSVGLPIEAQNAAMLCADAHERMKAIPGLVACIRMLARAAAAEGQWEKAAACTERIFTLLPSSDDMWVTAANERRLFAFLADDSVEHLDVDFIASRAMNDSLSVDVALRLIELGHVARAESFLDHVIENNAPGAFAALDRGLAGALRASVRGDRDQAVSAVMAAIVASEDDAVFLGATELRGFAMRRLAQLQAIGVEIALTRNQPALFAEIVGRVQGTLLLPEPDPDAEEIKLLERLRSLGSDLLGGNERDRGVQRIAIEQELRRFRRAQTKERSGAQRSELLDQGDHGVRRAYIAVSAGRITAAVFEDGQATCLILGEADILRRKLTALIMMASSCGRGMIAPGLLDPVRRSVAAFLGPLVPDDDETVLVVTSSAEVPTIPWALVADCPVSVQPGGVPTATAPDGMVYDVGTQLYVVSGPSLQHSKAEADVIAAAWPATVAVPDGSGRVSQVRAVLQSADMVHFSAHGRFRSENPLLSEIQLGDGVLTFFDFLRTSRSPNHVVLASCEVGRQSSSSPVGAYAVLRDRGCETFLASVGQVCDLSMVKLMGGYYDNLAHGMSPTAALNSAQRVLVADDPSVGLMLCFGGI